MPLLSIHTNQEFDKKTAVSLIQAASKLTAQLLNKPERYVMLKLETNPYMLFAGKDDPLVYAELKSIGLDTGKTSEYSAVLTDFLATKMQVPSNRIYIEFSNAEAHMWGWNGETF